MSDDDEHLHAALSGRNHAVRFLLLPDSKGLTDAAMISAAEHCGAALRTIDLTNCFKLTDDTLFSIAKNCSNLAEIKLSGLFNVSDAGIRVIAEGCPGLTAVDFSLCSRLTDESIKALAKNCPMLRRVGLGFLHNISDASVSKLMLAARQLNSLEIANCLGLSDFIKKKAAYELGSQPG